ncbi:hypothetical protein [Caenispirillum bisanense]|uniref:hypothetical protein n=1 Tax=Caenispirillum bisanense TaxID=414052 RepID=UPI0031D6B3FE
MTTRRPAARRGPPGRRVAAAAAAVVFALLVSAAGGGHEGETEKKEKKDTGPRRDQADTLSGQFILFDPLFIPVVDEKRGRTTYTGLMVRLEPNPERRMDACYAVPRILDALVIEFYQNRLTREQFEKKGPARKRVEDVVKRVAGPHLISSAAVFDQVPELDDDSIKLSRACK